MSRQKQNFLWLMIVCCVTCQITCSKIMIIGDTLTNTCFWSCNRSICPAINVTCPPTHEILIGDFCIMNVNQNTSILGHCKSSTGETYSFKITNDGGKYENTTNGPQTNTDKVEPQKASENLNKVESLVETMEKANKTNAAIVMGDVIGVLQRQPKDKPTKNISICYSSSQHMINVVESKENTGYPWSVKIPSEAFDKARLENNGSAFVGVLRFINMGNTDEPQNYTVLNNESYGITMGANISNLTDNVDMFFRHNDKVMKGSCVSWDGKGKLKWTTFGCETEINSNSIKCSCSHLTFFAVLMSLPNVNTTAPHLESLTLISSIGCGISMFFMAIALFMHFLLRKAKSNQATKILMNMFVALCLLNASFLSNESVANTEDNTACVFIALVQHYSMLASFTWFFIQALHMYLWLIRQNITITNYMRKITVLGWACAIPIVVAIVSIGGYELVTLNATSGKITRMCWITNPYIYYIVNIGYYALVFVFTTGIFIMIVTKVFEARKIKAVDGKRKTFRKQLMMVLSLFLLFGLTWSVAFFSYGPMIIPSYYIFSVLNSLQGFFLFLYYYHIHNDVEGNFSDDPDSTDSTITLAQSSINTVVESQSDVSTNCSWLTKISKEALNKSRLENNGSAFVGILQFKNFRNKNETENYTVLNNEVYGITMRAKISNLTDNIDMFFTHNDLDGNASCVSWDGIGELKWTTSGCETEINDKTITCSCSHLTFFAVLMSPPGANITASHLESLTVISSVGCGISMFFMAVALFMHFLLRKAKSNQATKILMNMFVALCLLNASFLSNESVANTQDNGACVFIALVLHYSMLASFTWFFIQALHMYLWLIRQNITITNYMRKITVLGWVNVGYYALVFIFTTGIFIMIATRVVQARNIKATDDKRKTFRKQLMMVLSLFLLFGLTCKFRTNYKFDITYDNPRTNYKCDITCDKSRTNYTFDITYDNSRTNYKFETTCNNSRTNYKFDITCDNSRTNYKFDITCDDSRTNDKFDITCDNSRTNYKFDITYAKSQPN
ncbi:hypothetical protein Q8A67_020017 [Cirrhinus molitorella]|uniref:Uncharacterized protein n=1 Tax=Cirrhinus molitorella TaxID=172907 RepID=A0AA88PMN2_9TELE|nr:hypothetical protein Q8A67_020017 [Cirrhinus molitorella]